MARGKTFKFGKTLVNVSSRGIATKDTTTGEIKRHAFPWTGAPRPVNPEPQESDYDGDEARDYGEAGEDAGYYADYDEEEYDGGDYGDEEPEEDYGEEEERTSPAGLLGSTWFMWLMLFLLPPLGIWLLWRNNRYEITPRSAISAAAVVWFIVLLIWLFSHIGGRDTTVLNVPSASPSPSPTAELAEPSATPNAGATEAAANATATYALPGTPDPGAGPTPNTAGTAVIATATPEPGATDDPNGAGAGTGVSPAQATFVYSTSTGQYYHSYATCSNMVNPDRVTLSVALSRKQTACPYCWTSPSATTGPTSTPLPAGMYYYRPDGTYYHLDQSCQGMKNAQPVSEADAIAAGKTACPVCIGSVYITTNGTWYHANSTCQGMKNAKKVTIADAKAAGKTECPVCMNGTPTEGTPVTASDVYYTTSGGTWYHSDATCQGMTNAYRTSAAAAEQAGKTPCPRCLNGNSGVANYYATSGGTYYHTDRTCSGMANATRVSLATAIARGQVACPKCAGGTEVSKPEVVTVNPGNTTNTNNAGGNTTTVSDSTYYSTADGTYFHRDPTCSGMKNATTVTAAQIASRGQQPCPKCIGTSGIYYSTPTGSYYHANPTCSGMTGANIVTLAMIRSRGQTACPKCIGGGTGNAAPTSAATGEPNGNYWATSGGAYYHATANCSGMTNAVRVTRATAESRGQKPCPTCLGSVYTTESGQWYHNDPTCQGMTGARLTTIFSAQQAGKTACPVCIGGAAPAAPTSTPRPVDTPSEENNLSYYATQSGRYYHRTATCSGMTGASRVSESTAVARGQLPCPVCIGSVYATDGGDYYHATADCSGMKGAKLMTVDQAELSGKSPCPTCMGGKPIGQGNNNTGGGSNQTVPSADGTTEVWVSIENARYHTSMTCSNLQYPVKTRLEQALKQGYTRCTICNAPVMTTST